MPAGTKFEAVTLERGITHDKEFANWANSVNAVQTGSEEQALPQDSRKDIIVEMLNEEGQLATAYRLFRCWVSEFRTSPELDSDTPAVAIESIKLENEGWECDFEVTGSTGPVIT